MQTDVLKGGETVTVWLRDQSGSTVTGKVFATDTAALRLVTDNEALGHVVIPWSNIALANCEGSGVSTGTTDYRAPTT